MNRLRIASFDIGKKNFSFYIEEFIPINIEFSDQRYNVDGTCTQVFENIIVNNVFNNGKSILLENIDLTFDTDKKMYLDPRIFTNMTNILDERQSFWDDVDIFVIEKQMSFRNKYNTMALKLGQHCYSYFNITYGDSKNIVEFPAYYKTQLLGCKKDKTKKNKYKAISKPKRKLWNISKAIDILKVRSEKRCGSGVAIEDQDEYIKLIMNSKKKDDLCDVICQLQAYKIKNYII